MTWWFVLKCLLPSQAKPSQAKPSQAKPSQAKPSQAKPSQAKPDFMFKALIAAKTSHGGFWCTRKKPCAKNTDVLPTNKSLAPLAASQSLGQASIAFVYGWRNHG